MGEVLLIRSSANTVYNYTVYTYILCIYIHISISALALNLTLLSYSYFFNISIVSCCIELSFGCRDAQISLFEGLIKEFLILILNMQHLYACVCVCVCACVCVSCGGCTLAGLWCNSRQMGEMAETNLKGLIHLITTVKDCRLPHHSSNMLFVHQFAGAPIISAYRGNTDCAIFLMKQHQRCVLHLQGSINLIEICMMKDKFRFLERLSW